MGIARLRSVREGETVKFSFAGPAFRITKQHEAQFAKKGVGAAGQACRAVILNLAGAAFPQGMDRKDGAVWADWQDVIESAFDDGDGAEVQDEVEVSRKMLDWMAKLAGDEKLKVQPAIAGWREALVDYLTGLRTVHPA